MVKLKVDLSDLGLKTFVQAHGGQLLEKIGGLDVTVIRVPELIYDQLLSALGKDPNVEFAEPDYIAQADATTNDPYVVAGQEWHLPKIKANKAWDMTTGQAATKVAVLDSGVQLNHPEFQGRLLSGYDFVNNDGDPTDDNGHGTAVAGAVAAAGNNAQGVAGVAYGVSILPVKVLDSTGYGAYSAIAKGIMYAADQGARIINVSISGASSSSTLQNAVDYAWKKNAVVFAAVGNESLGEPRYPAACKNAVGISATDSNDALADFSNFGPTVCLSAPGKGIWTTKTGNGYGAWSGTSFASPIAAGVAALALSVNPKLSATDLVAKLKSTADDLGPAGYDPSFGYGRINAANAIAASNNAPQDTVAPTAQIVSPTSGASVSKSVNVSVASNDNIGVAKVELFIDNQLAATTTTIPASFTWDTTVTENGTAVLKAVAYDAAGNTGSSAEVTVTVANSQPNPDTIAPKTRITSPTNGSALPKNAKVKVSAADDTGITHVDLYVDDQFYGSSSAAPYVFTLDRKSLSAGRHRLHAISYDAAGNAGASKIVRVKK